MIEQSIDDLIPEGAREIKTIGDRVYIYFSDDQEIIDFEINHE